MFVLSSSMSPSVKIGGSGSVPIVSIWLFFGGIYVVSFCNVVRDVQQFF